MKKVKKFLILCLLAGYVSFSYASDWPMFMGNIERTGYSSQTILPPLNFLWTYEIPGNIISSPVIYKNILYASSRNGSIYALNASNGELIWDYSTDGFIDATPAVSSESVIVSSLDGYLYSLNRINGELLWKSYLGAPSVSSPLIYRNKVYVGAGEPSNSLKAFDFNTGALLFSKNISQPVRSAPSFCGGEIIFAANDGKIYAVNAETGDDIFSYPFTGGAFEMNSSACGDDLFSLPGHDERKIFKNSPSDGSLISYSPSLTDNLYLDSWNWQIVSSPLISPSSVYISAGTDNAYLIGLNKNDLSEVTMSSVTLGSAGGEGFLPFMSMAGEIIFSGSADGIFNIVSSTGGILQKIFFSTSVFTAPALSDGRVYFADYSGKVYAYSSSKYASFDSLNDSDIINSSYGVKINALNTSASSWKLDYALDDGNFSYVMLASSSYSGSMMSSYPLYIWNTSQVPNGNYLLKFCFYGDPYIFQTCAVSKLRVNQKPLPPPSISASDNLGDNGNKILLSWPQSASSITNYRIYRSQGAQYSLLAQVSSSTLTYLDTTAFTGILFSYKISSWDGYLESDFSQIVSTVSVNDNPSSDSYPPSAISNLSCSPGTYGGSIKVSFTAPGDDGNIGRASHYFIKYATYPFSWSYGDVWKSSRPSGGAVGYAETEDISGLLANITYYFLIKSYDSMLNESPSSNQAFCLPAYDPIAPLGISGFYAYDTPGDKGGRITLTWNLSEDDGKGYNDVYGYKIYRSIRSGVYDYSNPYASVGKGVRGYIDNSATVNVRYFYRVAAFDSSNNSPLSEEVSAVSADNWRYVDFRNGGSLLSDDGAEILIPPNGLNQNDNMIMVKLNPSTLTPLSKINTAASPTGIVYEVKFDNASTKLTNFAEIKIPYTDQDIAGMKEDNLRIYQKTGDSWLMLDSSSVLSSQKKVYAKINSLGVYALMEYKPSGSLISSDSVYTYPNPAKGDKVIFKFRVSDKSDVKINVYNAAGEKVASLKKENCPAGVFSEIEWKIKNIASGVYVYTLEAVTSSGKKTLKEKMAIIH